MGLFKTRRGGLRIPYMLLFSTVELPKFVEEKVKLSRQIDIADGTKRDFDELYIERNSAGRYWIHFAVRPKDNRRKMGFLQT